MTVSLKLVNWHPTRQRVWHGVWQGGNLVGLQLQQARQQFQVTRSEHQDLFGSAKGGRDQPLHEGAAAPILICIIVVMDVEQVTQPEAARRGQEDDLAHCAAASGDVGVDDAGTGRKASLEELQQAAR